MMRKCELCDCRANMYCESDQASLCWSCDANVHGANFIVAKHSRTLLCHVCQAPTPWNASGHKLGPTVSVCENCINSQNVTSQENDGPEDDGDDDTGDGLDDNHRNDGNDEDDDDSRDGGHSSGGDDEDNQVVPLSSPTPPPVSSSSTSEQSCGGICAAKEPLSRSSATFSWKRMRGNEKAAGFSDQTKRAAARNQSEYTTV